MRHKASAHARRTFSALRKRNFRLYFTGQSFSLAGTWMQSVAQSWLVLHLTGSGAALGLVAALQYGPTLLLGPYAGVLADRASKRRILFVTQGLSGLLALVLGVAVARGAVTPGLVYATAVTLGVATAFDHPTRQSFLFELTGSRDVLSAVGLSSMAANLARVIGPAIAGVVIATVGMAPCFLVNASTAAVSVFCLTRMRASELTRQPRFEPESSGQLREGLAYAACTPVVRETIVMMAVVGVLTYEFSVTLPMLAKYSLGGDADAYAWLMSSMGVGAALGGLLTAGRRGEGLGKLVQTALAFGALTALAGTAPSLAIACAVMVFVGVFASRFTGLSNGILQLKSDPAMRNRVIALWSTAFLGSTFVGGPLIGWVGQAAGPQWALGLGAVGGVIAAGIGRLGLKRGRTAETTGTAAVGGSRGAQERAADSNAGPESTAPAADVASTGISPGQPSAGPGRYLNSSRARSRASESAA